MYSQQDFRTKYNHLLGDLTDALDIPESYRRSAEARYASLGKWLDRENSSVSQYAPEIFPQGSFLLGTVVRPSGEDDEYDIDLVCKIHRSKDQITQADLKRLVGSEIRSYQVAQSMEKEPEEKRRCWTLSYADEAKFHLDILPCIPERVQDDLLNYFGYNEILKSEIQQRAISITDNEKSDTYAVYCNDWPSSNPQGYAIWFMSRMASDGGGKGNGGKNVEASVSPVPQFESKTPLQRAIQVLKRHRDIMFKDDSDNKPISIIITTLAARAYDNERTVLETLEAIIPKMPQYIEDREGVLWVQNPTNPKENFADKWEKYEERRVNFFRWLEQVNADLLEFQSPTSLIHKLRISMGEKLVNKHLNSLSDISRGFWSASSMMLSEVTSSNLLNVSHRKKSKWRYQPKGEVTVSVSWTGKGFSRPMHLVSNASVRSGVSLKFEAHLSTIKKPYNVYWQVVNTGTEAEQANDLRGGFYEGTFEKGKRIRRETARYGGDHWVQCFVVKTIDGEQVCVAKSREFIVRIAS